MAIDIRTKLKLLCFWSQNNEFSLNNEYLKIPRTIHIHSVKNPWAALFSLRHLAEIC